MVFIRNRYKDYKFEKPIITESEFKRLKMLLELDKEYNINPKISFVKAFKIELIVIFTISLITLFVFIIDSLFFLIAIPIIVILTLSWGFIISLMNYGFFINEKNRFYKKLRKFIISSDNYSNFYPKYIQI